jgi:hypothetical protein
MTTDLEQTLQDGTFKDIEMSTNLAAKNKRSEIEEACDAADLTQLVRLANSTGGLVDDSLRCRAWPILLGYGHSDQSASGTAWRKLPEHRDELQVKLDVDRAFGYYPKKDSDRALSALKEQLFDLIVSVLKLHPALCYSQGYHDIAQVFLLVLGQDEARTALTYLSLLRIRDYMLPTLDPALKHLHLLPAIFRAADPTLAAHLSQINPYFAVSAILTLNAHDIPDYGDIARTFDFLLAHEPVMSLYLIAAIVISRREELLEIDDPDMLHFQLNKLPQPLDLQTYIDRALRIFDNYPPERLPGFVWWRLPSSSVLKTSRALSKMQSLEEAETIFQLQVKQVEQERKRKQLQKKASLLLRKNKRPVISISAALVVGCFAIWMRRTGHDQIIISLLTALVKSSRSG